MVIEKRRAFFLDRDGVLIKTKVIGGKPYAVHSEDDFKILPDVKKSFNILKKNNYLTIVITNQPDVGNNLVSKDKVVKINGLLSNSLDIDALFACYHSQYQNCECRKPKIFFFEKSIKKFNIDIENSYMIGDRYSDIEAGNTAGCKTIFIDKNYSEKKPINQNFNAESLYDAVKKLGLK
jgi:D-glycero-D-manno-heptose 1,7-bisphosphate phosphatase